MVEFKFPEPYEKKLPSDIELVWPSPPIEDSIRNDRILGSMVGLAIGDALGASVEFRPRQYLIENPVTNMMSGGTWGLTAGHWTDDTSMALCLASSLITHRGFNPYDQMVRYKWWYQYGYLSSTGECFDIGNATLDAIEEFRNRQQLLKTKLKIENELDLDRISYQTIQNLKFDVKCSKNGAAGNGALMRLAPVPLFFIDQPKLAVSLAGISAQLTHGDQTAIDACRYFAALIIAAILGESKQDLLSNTFYENHYSWFSTKPLHRTIAEIAKGSYQRPRGYDDGIRGAGHVVRSLEAALWAFWKGTSFENGALEAVNLGDDTDTTAAIYGQLAGAYYGYQCIPTDWKQNLYAASLIVCITQWLIVIDKNMMKHSILSEHDIDGTTLSTLGPKPDELLVPKISTTSHLEIDEESKTYYPHRIKKTRRSTSRNHSKFCCGCFRHRHYLED